MMTITYSIGDNLYVNVTNRCTNDCDFCIRHTESGACDADLWLDREPDRDEICTSVMTAGPEHYSELVFCGYGEPTYRIDDIIYTARQVKEICDIPIRINTNGHANRIAGRDVTPELEGCIDTLSISLNASSASKYNEICRCSLGEDGFYEMLDFAGKAKKYVPNVILSVVDTIGQEEIDACRRICERAGCEFRVRQYTE